MVQRSSTSPHAPFAGWRMMPPYLWLYRPLTQYSSKRVLGSVCSCFQVWLRALHDTHALLCSFSVHEVRINRAPALPAIADLCAECSAFALACLCACLLYEMLRKWGRACSGWRQSVILY